MNNTLYDVTRQYQSLVSMSSLFTPVEIQINCTGPLYVRMLEKGKLHPRHQISEILQTYGGPNFQLALHEQGVKVGEIVVQQGLLQQQNAVKVPKDVEGIEDILGLRGKKQILKKADPIAQLEAYVFVKAKEYQPSLLSYGADSKVFIGEDHQNRAMEITLFGPQQDDFAHVQELIERHYGVRFSERIWNLRT